jgi:hypothetical protein
MSIRRTASLAIGAFGFLAFLDSGFGGFVIPWTARFAVGENP